MDELQLQLSLYAQQTAQLEAAYLQLKSDFEQLKSTLALQEIVSHISDGLIFVTREGVITLFNQEAASITETVREEVLDTLFWDHFSDDLFGFPVGNALKCGHVPGRLILSLSNGKEIEVAPTHIPEKGLLLLLNDRTELKQLEKSVQQSERLKALGEMAATLAHEIRNPLGGIEGFAALLQREVEDEGQKRMLNAILEGSRTLNTLVTNVLDYGRPLTLHFVPTEMTKWLEACVALAHASGHKCALVIESTCTLSIDPQRMQLVLLNLIHNAYEAKAQRVEIILTKTKTVQVRDDGEGIEKEKLEKIFTPFFTTKTTGTGLGLSEAHKVIRAHGGTITVDSKVGKGTCITLELCLLKPS